MNNSNSSLEQTQLDFSNIYKDFELREKFSQSKSNSFNTVDPSQNEIINMERSLPTMNDNIRANIRLGIEIYKQLKNFDRNYIHNYIHEVINEKSKNSN